MRSVIDDPMPADDAGIQGDVLDFRGLAQANAGDHEPYRRVPPGGRLKP